MRSPVLFGFVGSQPVINGRTLKYKKNYISSEYEDFFEKIAY